MRASCVRSSYAFICLSVNNTASARPSNFLVNLPRRIPRRPKARRGEAALRRGPIKASAPARGEGTKDIASCVYYLLAPPPNFPAIIKHISYLTVPFLTFLCFTVAPTSSRQVGVMPSQAKPPPAASHARIRSQSRRREGEEWRDTATTANGFFRSGPSSLSLSLSLGSPRSRCRRRAEVA